MHSREDQRGATALVGPGASTTAFVQSACINFGIDRVREDNGAALLSQNNFGLTNPLKGPQEAAQPQCENLSSRWLPQHTPVTPALRTLSFPDLHFDF